MMCSIRFSIVSIQCRRGLLWHLKKSSSISPRAPNHGQCRNIIMYSLPQKSSTINLWLAILNCGIQDINRFNKKQFRLLECDKLGKGPWKSKPKIIIGTYDYHHPSHSMTFHQSLKSSFQNHH